MGIFRHGLIVALLFLAAVLLADPASAGDADTCRNASGDEAIDACTRAITSGEYGGNYIATLLLKRGLKYHAKGDNDRAMADYDAAIRLDPQNADAFYNRGVEYRNKGDYDRAIADFDEVIRLDPQDARAFMNRAFAFSAKGDPTQP